MFTIYGSAGQPYGYGVAHQCCLVDEGCEFVLFVNDEYSAMKVSDMSEQQFQCFIVMVIKFVEDEKG